MFGEECCRKSRGKSFFGCSVSPSMDSSGWSAWLWWSGGIWAPYYGDYDDDAESRNDNDFGANFDGGDVDHFDLDGGESKKFYRDFYIYGICGFKREICFQEEDIGLSGSCDFKLCKIDLKTPDDYQSTVMIYGLQNHLVSKSWTKRHQRVWIFILTLANQSIGLEKASCDLARGVW